MEQIIDNENTSQNVNLYRRVTNFSKKEEEKLIALALQHADVIENKKTDQATCKLKKETWEIIAAEFNCSGQFRYYRDSRAIREKYNNIKRKLRRCTKADPQPKKEKISTGGVVDELCGVIGVSTDDLNNKIDDEEENEFYLDADLPETVECVAHEPAERNDFYECNSSEVDKVSVSTHDIGDESQSQLPMLCEPLVTVHSKEVELSSGRESLVDLERQILEEQLNHLKAENEKAATERMLRVEQAATEHRLRVKQTKIEHRLRVEILKVKLKCLKKRT